MKYYNWIKETFKFLFDLNKAYYITVILLGSLAAYLQKAFGIFTVIVCVPRWVVTILPVSLVILTLFLQLLVIKWKSKKIHKQLFKKGDNVQLKGKRDSLIVEKYHNWNFTKVKCKYQKDGTYHTDWFDEAQLEFWTPIKRARLKPTQHRRR